MYNGGVIVVVCGVALCEEIRCISGGFIRGGVSPHLKEKSGVVKRWRPWGLSLVLSGGLLGLLPFPCCLHRSRRPLALLAPASRKHLLARGQAQ